MSSDDWNKKKDWFWEGNVQENILRFLEKEGYKIISKADTDKKERGPDILAKRINETLQVEVKGFPSDKYMSGSKTGMKKPTPPTLQARHWFSGALHDIISAKCRDENLKIALGLPKYVRYLKMVNNICWLRKRIELHVYFVKENGDVEHINPSDIIEI